MSVFQFQAQQALPVNVAVAGTTATEVVDASENLVFVPWFEVNDTASGTQALTVDVYDGTNARYLGSDDGKVWNATAVTADQSVKFTQGYVIPKGSTLRVTSDAATGDFHIHGVKIEVP